MKIERSTEDYGGGGGKTTFESENFRVILWNLGKGKQTEIECKLNHSEIRFNGVFDFKSDDECMSQFSVGEILEMIAYQKRESFKAGMTYKSRQIRECIEI